MHVITSKIHFYSQRAQVQEWMFLLFFFEDERQEFLIDEKSHKGIIYKLEKLDLVEMITNQWLTHNSTSW